MFLLKPQKSADDSKSDYLTLPEGMKLDGREWKYVAEGGANVLFRHHPPSSAADDETQRHLFYGKLLRVKKCDISMADAQELMKKCKKRKQWKCNKNSYPAYYPHPRKVLEYVTQDILPYLVHQLDHPQRERMHSSKHRNHYQQVAQLMEVPQRFLMELNEQLLTLESRPAHRRKSKIDDGLHCVMVLPDVTLPPPDDEPPVMVVQDESEAQQESEDSTSDSATEQTDEDLFDASSEGVDPFLEANPPLSCEKLHRLAEGGDNSNNVFSCSTATTITATSSDSSDEEANDADAETEGNEADEDEEEATTTSQTDAPSTSRSCETSGTRSIFDCCFRNIGVEIKPKIGFKPKGDLIPDVKKKVCRFCMHQHFKRSTGKVEEISEYCPLDLFSQDGMRIRKALRALQRTPQNNFKVFVRSSNDEVVNVITGMSADALPKGAAQAKYSCRRKRMGFRHSCQSIGAETDLQAKLDALTEQDNLLPDVMELLTEMLLKIEILEDLKQMQLLDHISVDGVWHFQQLLHYVEEAAADFPERDTLLLSELLERFADSIDAPQEGPGSLKQCLAFLNDALKHVPDIPVIESVTSWRSLRLGQFKEFYQQLEQRFQVATTLKDCSLLFCLRRYSNDTSDWSVDATGHSCLMAGTTACGNKSVTSSPAKRFEHLREYEHTVRFRDMVFHCVIAIVDLDVKSHKSVEDYYRLDEKIVQHYVEAFGARTREGEVCSDD
ncbi:hypothetical protein Poli38472_007938 [Pythium oligandrum]|uniref:inositol-pentakisphosphate 2-kinase n=1 Tax=Pythium oligandrum TaxID=41045 RepID=A0A8K1FJU2_PYTOL|nr:hypothetical protein Poli38472_007938 [Pythium oligandrum]|eukprot:TMW65296.1 hypothetical protein Poli38472_007938 [Pythium oligandrum]